MCVFRFIRVFFYIEKHVGWLAAALLLFRVLGFASFFVIRAFYYYFFFFFSSSSLLLLFTIVLHHFVVQSTHFSHWFGLNARTCIRGTRRMKRPTTKKRPPRFVIFDSTQQWLHEFDAIYASHSGNIRSHTRLHASTKNENSRNKNKATQQQQPMPHHTWCMQGPSEMELNSTEMDKNNNWSMFVKGKGIRYICVESGNKRNKTSKDGSIENRKKKQRKRGAGGESWLLLLVLLRLHILSAWKRNEIKEKIRVRNKWNARAH